MKTKNTSILLAVLFVLSTLVGILLYSHLPGTIASHWDAKGVVDGYMGKFWGVFLLPAVLLGLVLVYWIIPKIDPLRANIESFRKYYNSIWIIIDLFLVCIFALSMFWNLGYRFNFSLFMVPPVAVLFYLLGIVLQKSKRNWFVGIRTPWTLSSDLVWDRTHKLGGKLFKVAGIIALGGLFFNNTGFGFWFIIIPAIAVAAITIVYSYVIYRRGADKIA
jgi:uncharacterized membrane protein